jgi:hypothetical protein
MAGHWQTAPAFLEALSQSDFALLKHVGSTGANCTDFNRGNIVPPLLDSAFARPGGWLISGQRATKGGFGCSEPQWIYLTMRGGMGGYQQMVGGFELDPASNLVSLQWSLCSP